MTLLNIVLEARKNFEEKNVSIKELEDLYSAYNPDVKKTKVFVQRALDFFPRLNCGLTSVFLAKNLDGIKPQLIQGFYDHHSHTFLLAGETVIDITADQYGGPPVYIGPLQPPWKMP